MGAAGWSAPSLQSVGRVGDYAAALTLDDGVIDIGGGCLQLWTIEQSDAAPLMTNPEGIAVDSAGSIYVSFGTIVFGDPRGVLGFRASDRAQFFAHTNLGGHAYDNVGDIAVDASDNLWVLDTTLKRVENLDTANIGGVLQSWTYPDFNFPTALAIAPDTDHVWVGDGTADKTWEFTHDGTLVQTWPGTAQGGGPEDFDIEAGQYHMIKRNNQLHKYRRADGQELFHLDMDNLSPGAGVTNGIAIDNIGQIYVTEFQMNRLYKLRSNFSQIYEFSSAAGGPTPVPNFNRPAHVAVDSSRLIYVTDHNGHRVYCFDCG